MTISEYSASLLFNLESVATAAIAWIVFRENVDKRVGAGFALIVFGSILLSLPQEGGFTLSHGALLITAACLCWGIDNNLTRKISGSDPSQIAMWKGLVAGFVNTGMALLNGTKLPAMSVILGVTAIGFLGYGVSSFSSFTHSVTSERLAQAPTFPPRRLQVPPLPSQSAKANSIGPSALRAFSCLSVFGYTSPSDTNTSTSTSR